jgi:hypothetical protein
LVPQIGRDGHGLGITRTMTLMPSPTPTAPDPQRDEVVKRLKPYEVTARLTLGLSAPATIATPLVRQLLGRSGVQIGPSLLSAVNALVNIAMLRRARRQGLTLDKLDTMPLIQRRLAVGLLAWALLGPLVAAFAERTVILRDRSPLWAYPVDMAPRLALALGLVAYGRHQLHRPAGRAI